MKSINLFACLCLVVVAIIGCSDEKTKGKAAPKAAAPEIKVDDLKYSGAVIFEVGTTSKIFNEKNQKPTTQIYFCVGRTGNPTYGRLGVSFSDLGVAPLRRVWNDRNGNVSKIFDLTSFTIDYKFSGVIKSSEPYAFGEITFQSSANDQNWVLVYPETDDGSHMTESLFTMSINEGTLGSVSTDYYESGNQVYYVKGYLHRMVKNTDGTFPVDECEKHPEQPVFFKRF
jgi:hypothetical protein